MTDTPRRIFGIICLLVAVWIVTYWLYQPSEPPVTFGERPASVPLAALATDGPEPEPVAPEPAPAAGPAQAAASPPAGATGPRLEPPAFRWYDVQRGDVSMEVVAQKELGDKRYWRAIAEANPFVDPAKLKAGKTRLRIPLDPANIQGRVVEAPRPSPAAQEPAAPKPETAAAPERVVYTVAPGDTLSGIAKRFYGDPGLWRHIYEANRDTLRSPDDVSVGDKLTIPPKPAR